ncbi:lysophospholipase [Bosea sp. WAO]|uniref:alpha/beta hydrolase family protein n=1 Tax=Bosea sp. WAO TaxID=406341 RepID=UPI000748217A|nr:alpha/beta fold hydrolase [Bosea sp. WAO]KUL94570.1 lysophospholipase [Bosea sp. WAO]
MANMFRSEMHSDFVWAHGYIPYGGADLGEIRAVAEAVADGGDDAFHDAWVAAGARMAAQADALLAKGHATSARESYLRASVFYASSFRPLYGTPVDPRLLSAFRLETAAFDKALSLGEHPTAPIAIPFGEASLPGYFIAAEGGENDIRPLIIFTNGYDGTIVDTYFACAVAASRRGYHSLLFDGPGQGALLYERGTALRPDWEVVIKAVVDFAEGLPLVDAKRIALSGWSLGGYLAPRAASGEPRISALIADPGLWSIADGFRDIVVRTLGVSPEAAANLGELDEATMQKIDATIRKSPLIRWKVMDRGFWTHGVDNLRDYFASAELFTMTGRAEAISCPTLITQAENDVLGNGAGAFFDALTCPKILLRFSATEGADRHCEMGNRSLLNRRVLDWLDEQFGLQR